MFYTIIITYNPDVERLLNNLRNLRSQGFKILVVDNGSDVDLTPSISKNELILLGENKGIAVALNRGMEEAELRGAKWVLSLDQDTEIAENLLEEYCKYLDLPDLGALSPKVKRRGENDQVATEKIEILERCPTSGFFTSVDVWRDAGKYDEWMFIDYVDYDICMKIKLTGRKIYRINSTYMIQELGKLEVNKFFDNLGKIIHVQKIRNFAKVYNHSPLRNYYFVRNALYYRYKYKGNIDLRSEKSFLLRWEIKKLVLEKNKLANLKSISRGIRDFNIKKRQMEDAER